MKIRIDPLGYLQIERGGIFRDQFCPVTSDEDGHYYCGDWCPMFGEPSWKVDPDNGKRYDHHIQLCHIALYGQITDERGTK